MIKKHIIACSAILVLTMGARMFFFDPSHKAPQIFAGSQAPEPEYKPDEFYNSLNFANEDLPLGDDRIKWRMNKYLRLHSYTRLQTTKLHKKASQWFPVIEPLLKFYGIPSDFKYIPLVESGLLGGTSPKGASGYWQFMPGTARSFGLVVNDEIDERQHVRKSTVAACKYIRSLYREFNSWTLAAAAYNVGENSLKRQISYQKQDNYFKMKLNRETASYVYKLISMKEIIEHPRAYGYGGGGRQLTAALSTRKADNYFPDAHANVMLDVPVALSSATIN